MRALPAPSAPQQQQQQTTTSFRHDGLEYIRATHPAPSSAINRPLVLVIGWIGSTQRHIRHYLDLYLERGIDVLWFAVRPIHVLFPDLGKRYAARIVHVLSHVLATHDRPLLIHAFSGGGYFVGQIFEIIYHERRKQYGSLGALIIGIILDSPVEVASAPDGIAKSAFSASWLIFAIRMSIMTFLLCTYPITRSKHFKAASRVHDMETNCPTLVFWSKNDRIGRPEDAERFIKNQQKRGREVFSRCWDKSAHVSHLRFHQKDYTESFHSFVDYCLGRRAADFSASAISAKPANLFIESKL